jgi:hypothetical protein
LDAGVVEAVGESLNGFSVTSGLVEIKHMLEHGHMNVAAGCVAAVCSVRSKVLKGDLIKDYVSERRALQIVRGTGSDVSDNVNYGGLRLIGLILITTSSHPYLSKIVAKMGNPLTGMAMGTSQKATAISASAVPELTPQWTAVLSRANTDMPFKKFMVDVASLGYLIGDGLARDSMSSVTGLDVSGYKMYQDIEDILQ